MGGDGGRGVRWLRLIVDEFALKIPLPSGCFGGGSRRYRLAELSDFNDSLWMRVNRVVIALEQGFNTKSTIYLPFV